MSLETRPSTVSSVEVQALLYGSTLRWYRRLDFSRISCRNLIKTA